MVVRLLATCLAIALLVLALGSTERVVVPDSALAQGLATATSTDQQGSVEDHHLDDLPAPPAAEQLKLDPMAVATSWQYAPTPRATPSWAPGADPAVHRDPALPGLLRPPCA